MKRCRQCYKQGRRRESLGFNPHKDWLTVSGNDAASVVERRCGIKEACLGLIIGAENLHIFYELHHHTRSMGKTMTMGSYIKREFSECLEHLPVSMGGKVCLKPNLLHVGDIEVKSRRLALPPQGRKLISAYNIGGEAAIEAKCPMDFKIRVGSQSSLHRKPGKINHLGKRKQNAISLEECAAQLKVRMLDQMAIVGYDTLVRSRRYDDR